MLQRRSKTGYRVPEVSRPVHRGNDRVEGRILSPWASDRKERLDRMGSRAHGFMDERGDEKSQWDHLSRVLRITEGKELESTANILRSGAAEHSARIE